MNEPGDRYEQEADAVADRVVGTGKKMDATEPAVKNVNGRPDGPPLMTQNAPHIAVAVGSIQPKNIASTVTGNAPTLGATQPGNWTTGKNETIQRQEELPEDRPVLPTILPAKIGSADGENLIQAQSLGTTPTNTSSLQSQLNGTKGSGVPLQPAINDEMSRGIGADFSQVRVHTGSSAVQMNQQLSARAFTHGSDVYFNTGEFNPDSQNGKRLLAHELTHVVQQGAAGRSNVQTKSIRNLTGAPQIQRNDKEEKEVPAGKVEFRKGWIVVNFNWYMDGAIVSKGQTYSLHAWRAILGKLRRQGSLYWVTDSQIEANAKKIVVDDDLLPLWDKGEVKNLWIDGYTVVRIIRDNFGLPSHEDFMFFLANKEIHLLVKTSKIELTDSRKINRLLDQIIKTLLHNTKIKTGNSKEEFRKKLKAVFEKGYKSSDHTNLFVIKQALLHEFFGKAKWEKYLSKIKPGISGSRKKSPPAPDWVIRLKANVKDLLETERLKNPTAGDLPDRFYVYWYNGSWRGAGEKSLADQKKKNRSSIKVKANSEPGKVLARIRSGLQQRIAKQEKKVVHRGATKKRKIDPQYQWAEDIRRTLMLRVTKETKGWRNHKRLNVPDELSLHLVDRPGSEKKDVFLVVTVVGHWRLKNGEFHTPRKSAIFPVTLQPEMKDNLSKLYHQVNMFAFHLRRDPKDKKKTDVDPEIFKGRIDEPFPAYITVKNMRPDFRTVTGGEHEFFMAVNYFGKGYRQGVESTVEAMRTTYTNWKIFKLDQVLPVIEAREKKASESADEGNSTAKPAVATAPEISYDNVDDRYRKQRNADQKRIAAEIDAINRDSTGEDIFEGLTPFREISTGYDQEVEYKMPRTEGDYVIYATTIFRSNDKRHTLGSRAAFVFRVLDGYKLAKQEAHKRPNRIKAIEQQLQEGELSGKEHRALQQELRSLKEAEATKYSLFDKFRDNEKNANTALRLYGKLLFFYRMRRYPSDLDFIMRLSELKDKDYPKDSEHLQALWTQFLQEYGPFGRQSRINGLKNRIEGIKKSKRQIRNFRKRLNRYSGMFNHMDEVETPETVLVSEVTGQAYRLLMMVGEASSSVIDDDVSYMLAKHSGKKVYVLADVTTKESDRFVGVGRTKSEAIQNAFEKFAEDNAYGEGYLHYRIPGGTQGRARNEPGLKRQVLNALKVVAAVAGIVALALGTVATGGALGAIAFAAGLTAGVSGGIVAAHSISERVENNRFSFDVEFAMDLVNIIGAFAAGAGAITKLGNISRLGATATAITRASNFLRLNKVLALHGIADFGANAILLSLKVQKDIEAIEKSDMPDKKKAALKRQVMNNAIQSGAMMMVSTKGLGDDIKVVLQRKSSSINHADYETLNQHTGITREDGEFSFSMKDQDGVPISRKKVQAEAEADVPSNPTKRTDSEASSKTGTRPKPATNEKASDPKKLVTREYDPLPEGTAMQPKNATDVDSIDIMYNNLIKDSVGREAGIYRNTETGEYVVIQGDAGTVFVLGPNGAKQGPGPAGYAQEWKAILNSRSDKGRWELQAHYHPAKSKTEGVVDANRMPSGGTGDFGVLVRESSAGGGTDRVSKIDFFTKEGPDFTIFSYRPDTDKPFIINYPDPKTKKREILEFKTLEEYHQWMLNKHKVSLGEVPADLKNLPTKKGTETDGETAKSNTDGPVPGDKSADGGAAVRQPTEQTVSPELRVKMGKLRTRLRRARLDRTKIERLLTAGLQTKRPDEFFSAVQALVKKRSKMRKTILDGLLSTNKTEFDAAVLLAQRLAKGGSYSKRVRRLLDTFSIEQIGRGVQYTNKKHEHLSDGWVFRRLERAAQAHRDGAEIMVWTDRPSASKDQVPEGSSEVGRGKGEALIDQGVKGDIGEYELTLETLRQKFGKSIPEAQLKRMVDRMFGHEFTAKKRPESVRRALRQFTRDGDLKKLLDNLPPEGAIEIELPVGGKAVRRVDHLRSENGRPIFRENKNVTSLKAEKDSHIRKEIDKDIALLKNYPDAVVEWRMTDTDRKTAGMADIADQSFLDYVRDTATAAGVADRFILIGDDVNTTALMIPAASPAVADVPSGG